MVKAIEQHTVMPLQDAGGDNRFSALYALLDSEDTKPVHVSAPLQAAYTSAPDLIDLSSHICTAGSVGGRADRYGQDHRDGSGALCE